MGFGDVVSDTGFGELPASASVLSFEPSSSSGVEPLVFLPDKPDETVLPWEFGVDCVELGCEGRRGERRALLKRLEGNWRPGVLGVALAALKALTAALIFFLPVYDSMVSAASSLLHDRYATL